MTAVTVPNIQGTGTYAVPTNESGLLSAQAGFEALMGGVANLAFEVLYARVDTQSGVGAPRTLAMFMEGVTYSGNQTLDASTTQTMLAAIETALTDDANITTVGTPLVNMAPFNITYIWERTSKIIQPLDLNDLVLTQQRRIDASVFSGAVPSVSYTDLDLTTQLSGSFQGRAWLRIDATAPTTQITFRDNVNSLSLTYSDGNNQSTPTLSTGQVAHVCVPVYNGIVEMKGSGSATITLVSAM